MSDGSSKFVIELPLERSVLDEGWALVKKYSEAIIDRAEIMLRENLPDWKVVEAEVVRAFNQYVRPIDIPYVPSFIEGKLDDWLCVQAVAKVKLVYDQLSAQD